MEPVPDPANDPTNAPASTPAHDVTADPSTTTEVTVQTLPPLRKTTGKQNSPYWAQVKLLDHNDPRRSADDKSPTHVCKLWNQQCGVRVRV